MSLNNGKSAQQKKSFNAADCYKEVWAAMGLKERDNLSKDDVLKAARKLASDNQKGVEAGKNQPKLISEAESRARNQQRAVDEREIRDLKIKHSEEIKKLKAEHSAEIKELKTQYAAEIDELKAQPAAKKAGRSSRVNPAFMTDAVKQRMQDAAKKAKEAFDERDSIIEDQHFADTFMSLDF